MPTSNSTTVVFRPKHTESCPTPPSPESINGLRRDSLRGGGDSAVPPASTSASSTWLTAAIPSPSLVAARSYYLERISPIGSKDGALQGRRSLIQGQEIPRRHSLAPTTKSSNNSASSETASDILHKIKLARDLGDVSRTEIKRANPLEPSSIVPRRPSSSQPIIKVPFQYTHDRLRTWGYAYLGNASTADAFINAVSLRRPSLIPIKEERFTPPAQSAQLVTIRARVLPKARDRKPFLIQRQFDIEDLRNSIPAVETHLHETEGNLDNGVAVRRSARIRRQSTQQTHSAKPRRGSLEHHHQIRRPISPTSGNIPIHIEYALHYLPVLGALMLSGHVLKGDTIDLPLPHPEAFHPTIAYIYTGCGAISFRMGENIKFLAGRVV